MVVRRSRNRFLYDAKWLILRAQLDWSNWSTLQKNLPILQAYFDKKPIWARAYRIWRLLHQVAGFSGNPFIIKAKEDWYKKMLQCDKGDLSDIEASEDTSTCLDVGMTLRELRALKRLVKRKPNWAQVPNASAAVARINGRIAAR